MTWFQSHIISQHGQPGNPLRMVLKNICLQGKAFPQRLGILPG